MLSWLMVGKESDGKAGDLLFKLVCKQMIYPDTQILHEIWAQPD